MSTSHSDQLTNQREVLASDADLPGQRLLPAVVESVLGSLGGQAFHNFRGDKMEVFKQVALATGPRCMHAKDVGDKEIAVQRFYVHQVQIAGDSNGEYSDGVRCVLIGPDDTAVAFVSAGIAQDLARIIATFGMGPYDPPLLFKLVPFDTRLGRRSYSLQPA